MTDLAQLIERVEKATGPDRELDCLIYATKHWPDGKWTVVKLSSSDFRERAFQWRILRETLAPHVVSYGDVPAYTASLDTALQLCEPGWEYSLSTLYGIAHAELPLNVSDFSPVSVRRQDGNMPLAICEAAIRARAARQSATVSARREEMDRRTQNAIATGRDLTKLFGGGV